MRRQPATRRIPPPRKSLPSGWGMAGGHMTYVFLFTVLLSKKEAPTLFSLVATKFPWPETSRLRGLRWWAASRPLQPSGPLTAG
jgi:hypothetical protein